VCVCVSVCLSVSAFLPKLSDMKIAALYGLWIAYLYHIFPTLSHKRDDFQEKVIECKMFVFISIVKSTRCTISQIYFILKQHYIFRTVSPSIIKSLRPYVQYSRVQYSTVILCIVCMYMCTELLSQGGYQIAVTYHIKYSIRYTSTSYRFCDCLLASTHRTCMTYSYT
jgi:hypothetical protein